MSIANLDEAHEIINLEGKNSRRVVPHWYVVVKLRFMVKLAIDIVLEEVIVLGLLNGLQG